MFYLYSYAAENDLILDNQIVAPSHFSNIINLACNVGKDEWAEDFIKKWSKFLEPDSLESALDLGNAQIAFARKEFDQVLDILRSTDSNDPFNHLLIRMLRLASYYEKEKGDINFILDNSRAFDAFLVRSKIMNQQMKYGAKNLSSYIRKLVNRKETESKIDLYESLKHCDSIYFRWWLEQKIFELN